MFSNFITRNGVANLFKSYSVNKIVSTFQKVIDDLEDAEIYHSGQVEINDQKRNFYEGKMAESMIECSRAANISRKLKEFLAQD